MKFGVITGKHKAEVHEHAIPDFKNDQVLIKNKACNICTADYQQWLGLRPHQKIPMAFGHENAGIVSEIGSNVKNVSVGDHVVTNIYAPCMECENCRKNKNSLLCLYPDLKPTKMNGFGYYGPYGCSEYKVADSKSVFKVSNELPFQQMAFCEPVATVIHGIEKLNIRPCQKILVIGAGTMGILNALSAKKYGADVIVSDVSDAKRENARAMGFDKVLNPLKGDYKKVVNEYTDGTGVDAVIIAVGVSAAYKQAIDVSRMDGKLLIFAAGYPAPTWDLDPNIVHYKILNVIGTYGCNSSDFQKASELLSDKSIDVEKLVQKTFELDDIQNAFIAATQKDEFRISVML